MLLIKYLKNHPSSLKYNNLGALQQAVQIILVLNNSNINLPYVFGEPLPYWAEPTSWNRSTYQSFFPNRGASVGHLPWQSYVPIPALQFGN